MQLPSVVSSQARVTCAHEWMLVRGLDGQLVGNTCNFLRGINEGYRVATVDRGSSVQFAFSQRVAPGQWVSEGDTIASIYSSATQERLISLRGQLTAAKGLLAVTATGEKTAVVQEAEQRLTFAIRKRGEQQATLARTKTLYEAKLIPVAQYESAQYAANSAEDEVANAQTALEAARTGAKPEQVEFVKTTIAALKQEIAAVESHAATHTIVAPLSGRVACRLSSDTLLTIADTTLYIARIPVRWQDYTRVANTPKAKITLRGLSQRVQGTIVGLDREAVLLGGENVVIATAVLDTSPAHLVSGLTAACDIACRPVSLLALIKAFIADMIA